VIGFIDAFRRRLDRPSPHTARRPVGEVPVADVCLILEGTYPYVRGGVSSWVHQLIGALPDTTFSLLAVSASRDAGVAPGYELPDNVVSFAEVFAHELVADRSAGCPRKKREAAWKTLRAFHERGGCPRRQLFGAMLENTAHPGKAAISVEDAFYSRESWQFITDRFRSGDDSTSFLDYFWTWRAIHAPLFQTLVAEIPPARVYHAVSTGYAGLLGAVAKHRTGRPLLLTEHGIYVRERGIDIGQADWIYEEPALVRTAEPDRSRLKQLWRDFFATIADIAYQAADEVITLSEANRELQFVLGATPERSRVIPNGVDVARFAPLRDQRRPRDKRRIGFVGRVVRIKDVKTLLRAFALVCEKLPDVELWIVGPMDEDPDYARQCRDLCRDLDIDGSVRFTGSRNVDKIYPELDVMVLTSISEGQPLTILEAACAGVPTVATDVGACRELCEGRTESDRALGPSGLVTRIARPDETAAALLSILNDDKLREQMSRAGAQRAEACYRQEFVANEYGALYREHGSD